MLDTYTLPCHFLDNNDLKMVCDSVCTLLAMRVQLGVEFPQDALYSSSLKNMGKGGGG